MQSAELTTLNEATSLKAMGRANQALLETLSLVGGAVPHSLFSLFGLSCAGYVAILKSPLEATVRKE
jgi:hypothetical protein